MNGQDINNNCTIFMVVDRFLNDNKTLPDDKCLSPTDDLCVDTEPRVLHGHCCSDNNQGMTWLCQVQGQIEWHSQRISS